MTIPAELRRSAIEDVAPLYAMNAAAWNTLTDWSIGPRECIYGIMQTNDLRTFMLLVACAVESES